MADAAASRPVTIKITPEIKDRLKHLADARHRTPHWLMREAIMQYVEREEKREAFRQRGVQTWQQYQTTGLHATAREADAWLARLEAGQDLEPPECHV